MISNFEIIKNFYNDVLSKIADVVDTFSNLWWLVTALIVLVVSVNSIMAVRKRANKYTNEMINILKQDGKYIPGIFIELNNIKETIRFFVFGYKRKWKKRIISEFNKLYDNTYGNLLQEGMIINADSTDVKFSMKSSERMYKVIKTIDANLGLHDGFSHRNFKNYREDFKETQYIFKINSRVYIEKLQDLLDYSKASVSRYLILTGSAGNGKTNLLCNISEMLLRANIPCLFINARDIGDNPEEFILQCLNLKGWIKEHPKFFFWTADKILMSRRKKLYIIIDAINENESKDFGHKLALVINDLLSNKRIKIILSCRTEYFKEKFESTVKNEVTTPALILDVKEGRYNQCAMERLFNVYCSYFHFTGSISDYVKDRLLSQLLLLRIFFEVYHDCSKSIVDLNRHELFAEYIKEIQKKISVDLDVLLSKIAATMMTSMEFSTLAIKDISFTKDELAIIPDIADKSVLISKKILKHENTILSNAEEHVYFVFDEIRDYVLAKYILKNCTMNNVVNTDSVAMQLDNLAAEKGICLEGVLVHTYSFFKVTNEVGERDKNVICKKILYDYIQNAEEIDFKNFHRRSREYFDDPGIRLIVGTGLPIEDYEIDYLKMQFTHDNYWRQSAKYLYLLVQSALNGGQYSIWDFMKILYKAENIDEFSIMLRDIFGADYINNFIKPTDIVSIYEKLVEVNANEALAFRQLMMFFFGCYQFEEEKYNMASKYFRSLPDSKKVWKDMLSPLRFVDEEHFIPDLLYD